MTQQVIDIGSAPDDATGDPLRTSFDKTNENFTELYAKGATEGLWNYNKTSADTSTAPVSGRFKTNSGNYRDATQIAIHAITIQGIDRSSTLRTLLVGDLIQCQDKGNAAAWCRYSLQSLPVDHGTWFQLNVTFQADGGVASGDNQEIIFVFTAGSGGNADLSAYATLASPTFTGDPKAPTPATADNDTSIATTAYVQAQGYLTSAAATAAYQPLDADLTAIAALTGTNTIYYRSAANTWAAVTVGANLTFTGGTLAATGGGGGNVSNSGTPTVGQYGKWVTATTIQGVAPATVLSDIGGAPVGAEYITSTADATLTAERALTDTATVTWDRTTAGQIKANAVGGGGGTSAPQGRLTLQTATPVMTTTQSAKTTIYYTPYVGNTLPIYNGTSMTMTTFAELSVATTDTTKSPAAIGASKVNDWFVWSDAGTLRIGHGPDWTSDTARSAGTALVLVNGIWLNNASLTNGPAAQRGTYVGTTRSSPASELNWIFGGLAANGTGGFFGVWNTYNRVLVASQVRDGTDGWTLASGTIQAANNSLTMRVSYVCGIAEDAFQATYSSSGANGGGGGYFAFGVGYDSTTVFSGITGFANPATVANVIMPSSGAFVTTSLGYHFLSALETMQAGGTGSFYGDAGSAVGAQNGLTFSGMM